MSLTNLAGQLIARNTTDSSTDGHQLLAYTPSNALTAICCFAYLALALALSWNMWRHGGKYMLAMVIGCYIYAAGIALRFPLRTHMTSLNIFIAENLLVTLAPCGFIATEYMLLGRLAAWLRCTRHLLIAANRITVVFMISDIGTFLMQGAGAGMTSSTKSAQLGSNLLKIGIIIQLISFCIFIVFLVYFIFKVHKEEQPTWVRDKAEGWREDWRSLAFAICASCVGVLVRSFYRVIEMSQGSNGHLSSTEGYFYALDALPLFCALSVYIPFWPGRFIPDGLNLKAIPSGDGLSTPHDSSVLLTQYKM